MTAHVLALRCQDAPGIVASVSGRLFELGANIVENAQFTDPATGTFCMRTVFDVGIEESTEIAHELGNATAQVVDAQLWVRRVDSAPNMLIMVSKYDHCLLDLLYRHHSGEVAANIVGIVSNHADLGNVAERAGIDFHHIPVTPDSKPAAEAALLRIVEDENVDLVVLARYMQILGDEFCRTLSGRIINIHHSFLPGFKGAKPYHQAWARGVKLIGATAHYVTADLDEGPIIAQDVREVSHVDSPEDMVVVGRDIERDVLSAAVKAHVEERVFLVTDRTVVFPSESSLDRSDPQRPWAESPCGSSARYTCESTTHALGSGDRIHHRQFEPWPNHRGRSRCPIGVVLGEVKRCCYLVPGAHCLTVLSGRKTRCSVW